MDAVGLRHGGPGLFTEEDSSVPVMQSYWYDNQGKTLPRYKYNQLCFVEGDTRYLKRNGGWQSAPRQQDGELEPSFEPLPDGIDPVMEFVPNRGRREYLQRTVEDFLSFSSTIPT